MHGTKAVPPIQLSRLVPSYAVHTLGIFTRHCAACIRAVHASK
jgi:hypothetical protein